MTGEPLNHTQKIGIPVRGFTKRLERSICGHGGIARANQSEEVETALSSVLELCRPEPDQASSTPSDGSGEQPRTSAADQHLSYDQRRLLGLQVLIIEDPDRNQLFFPYPNEPGVDPTGCVERNERNVPASRRRVLVGWRSGTAGVGMPERGYAKGGDDAENIKFPGIAV